MFWFDVFFFFVRVGKLRLVDLAGSERQKKAKSSGQTALRRQQLLIYHCMR